MGGNSFEKKLRVLNEISNEMTVSPSVRVLCRDMVKCGHDRLGFDRISVWFIDKNPKFLKGSFAIDEKGKVREESKERVRIDSDHTVNEIHTKKLRSILRNNVPLYDHRGGVVGRGAHIIAAVSDHKKVVGYVSIDNLIRKAPFTGHDRELLELFASTFGRLYSLKMTEDALKCAFTELKNTHSQLIQAAKMEVVGSLASGVAHEVKNPLAIIVQGIDYISRKIGVADFKERDVLARMRRSIKKADDIIKGLLDFSMLTKPEFILQDVRSIVEKSLRLLGYEINKYNISVNRSFEKGLPEIRLDKNKIEQVFVNVFLNAINGMQEGGELNITAHAEGRGRGGKVVVDVEDTGPGIPDELIEKVFDPFFTTRRAIGGTGLGLTIARNIMDMHKGRILLENRHKGHGVRVRLIFRK